MIKIAAGVIIMVPHSSMLLRNDNTPSVPATSDVPASTDKSSASPSVEL